MLLQLFLIFLGVTIIGFGGANGILPILHEQLVELNHLLSQEEFIDLVGISQLTPGPILVNSATYAGLKVAGLLGALVTTIGIILPSFLILSVAMLVKHHYPRIFHVIKEGFRPLALSLLALGILVLCKSLLFSGVNSFSYKVLFLIILGFLLVRTWRVPSIYIYSLLGISSILIDFIL